MTSSRRECKLRVVPSASRRDRLAKLPLVHPLVGEQYERALSFLVAHPPEGDGSDVTSEEEHRAAIEFLIENRHRFTGELGVSPAEFHQSLATLEAARGN